MKDRFPGPWQVGDIISPDMGGDYNVKEIKVGGMGQVYVCLREEDMAPFVLKTFQEKYLSSKVAIDRFRWEAEVWVRLGRHKNIVKAHRVENSLGYTFVLLEYVVGDEYYGSDLSGWIRKGGLSIPLVLDFACQFCNCMIHAKKTFEKDPSLKPPFVHRDIKPQNIMVTGDRVVKVTDFGLVKAFELLKEDIETEVEDEFGEKRHSFTKKGGVCGTFPYIAPEIWLKIEPDERADIYSFGCVLYQMFYGVPPFVYSLDDPEVYGKYEHAHLHLSPRRIRDIPDEINESILKCLEKERGYRYHDFKVLRDDLAELYYKQTGERLVFREETETEWGASDWLEKGVGLIHLGFYEEAVECNTKSIRLNPNYEGGYNNRGIAYHYLSNYERAIEDYGRAIKLNPKNISCYICRSAAYNDLGNYQRAIEDSNEAIRLNQKNVLAFLSRGNAYDNLGNHERAIEDFDEAIRLNPKYAFAYNNRGTAYRNLGQNERGISDHDEAIRLDPRNACAYCNRGNAYYTLGQYERAISDYDEAIRLDPKDAFPYKNRGLAYDALGQYERAISDYDEAIRLDPKYAIAYNNRGGAYYNLGQYESAISDYDEAIRFDPKNASACYNKAACLQENLKRDEEALEVWEKYLEVAKDDPTQKEQIIKAKEQIEKLRSGK